MFSKPLLHQDAQHWLGVMRNRRVLVIGDIMIDEWIWGRVSRISPEAPVPVVAVNNHSFTLGGAGNVANNLRALGASVSFAGIVGNDPEGRRVISMLEQEQVNHDFVLCVDDRPTTRKTRVVAHNQQVVRADWESSAPLREHDIDVFCRKLAAGIPQYDAIVLSDYAKGVFSRALVETALVGKIVVADPKPKNIDLFSGVTCVAPNVFEASGATGIEITDDAQLTKAGLRLLQRLSCRYVVITLGDRGMALFGAEGEHMMIPSVARTVFDVSGAGDTVTAVLTLALAAGAPIVSALQLANFSAGAVVEKLGTATATCDEILAFIEEIPGE
jgi:rfaE bifunctional protein kinase chain/domain